MRRIITSGLLATMLGAGGAAASAQTLPQGVAPPEPQDVVPADGGYGVDGSAAATGDPALDPGYGDAGYDTSASGGYDPSIDTTAYGGTGYGDSGYAGTSGPYLADPYAATGGQVYVQGRWNWNAGNWSWLGGRWMRARPGYVWVDGYWATDAYGRYYWVDGYWQRIRRGYAWMPGRWAHRHGRWSWAPGSWIRHRPGYAYHPGRWHRANGRLVWRGGAWRPHRGNLRAQGPRRGSTIAVRPGALRQRPVNRVRVNRPVRQQRAFQQRVVQRPFAGRGQARWQGAGMRQAPRQMRSAPRQMRSAPRKMGRGSARGGRGGRGRRDRHR